MSPEITEEIVEIESPSGLLEGVLAYPCASLPTALTLLLSPHPHLGGNMENNVVRHLAGGCAAHGHATLRFNYHGVGNSTMRDHPADSTREYWAQIEKTREYHRLLPDIAAAWHALRCCVPKTPRELLIGYSLGAVLAGLSSQYCPNATVIAIAPPVGRVTMSGFEGFQAQKVFVTGYRDFAFDADAFVDLYAPLPEPKEYIILPDADHFFRRSEDDLYRAIEPFLDADVEFAREDAL